MLERLSDQIRVCHERASDAKRKAEESADPTLKADFLALEQRWLALARSYAFTDSLGDFTAAMSERRQGSGRPSEPAPLDYAVRLQEISTTLIQEGSVEALYERLLDAVIDLMSSEAGSIQALDAERSELQLLAWRGFHPESAAFWDRVRLGSACTCGQALSSGLRVVVPDIEACEWMAGTADLDSYRRSRIRAVQSTPLLSRSGRLLGMMSTHWLEPHQPTDRALRVMDVLARQAADLIERNQAEAALRESEERCRRLANEVDHRARNLLTLVQATVHASNAPTTRELKAAIEGRIHALGRAHALLSNSRWMGANVAGLVHEELSPYESERASRATITGPELRVEARYAQAVAMILHELTTNAVKYGALSVSEGSVRVDWSYPNDGRFLLRWTEADGPSVKPPRRKGFGSIVIEQLVRHELNGEARLEWRAEGLVCEIVLPAEVIIG